MVTHKSLNGLGLPKRGILPRLSVRGATDGIHGGKEMVFKVRNYTVAFDDGRHDAPTLETVCTPIVDGLIQRQADADAILSQLKLLCHHRPLIIAAFMPEERLRKHNAIIAREVETE
jgi:hypothetical protein